MLQLSLWYWNIRITSVDFPWTKDIHPFKQHLLWKKKLWGDNLSKMQSRIIVIFYCTSFHCHLSIYQHPLFKQNIKRGGKSCKRWDFIFLIPFIYIPSFISIPVLSKIWPRQASIMEKKWLRGDNSINIQGRIMCTEFLFSAIYLDTKFQLNPIRGVVCQTRVWQTETICFPLQGALKLYLCLCCVI